MSHYSVYQMFSSIVLCNIFTLAFLISSIHPNLYVPPSEKMAILSLTILHYGD